MQKPKTDAELEREARTLAEQADRFLGQFSVDLGSAETYAKGSAAFRAAADAYERMALAEKTVDQAAWYKAENVDGRTARDLMDRLWNVRQELERREDARRRRKQ